MPKSSHGRAPAIVLAALTLLAVAPVQTVRAQAADAATGANAQDVGEQIYRENCASCHSVEQSARTPSQSALSSLTPRAVVASLEADGVMRAEGASLTREQRIAIAEYLTRRPFDAEILPDAVYCSDRGWSRLDLSNVYSMGFGGDLRGSGYQPAERAGMDADDVGGLELVWAFAYPGATQASIKPAVVGDVVLTAGQRGEVMALDAASGCVRWSFEADARVRGAIVAGEDEEGRSVAYFTDSRTNAYALDTADGSLLWKTRVGWHPQSSGRGSPVLHDGRLIVPVSSMEVSLSANPTYPCCTSSGGVGSVDVTEGYVTWYYRVIPGYPEQVGENSVGTPLFAPAGAPVWSSPTIDVERGHVYIGSGESYTLPASEFSDAVIALDLETGEAIWTFQATEDDAWNMACTRGAGVGNCPATPGPDHDFGMAPIVETRSDGSDILLAGQKSGMVWALDPDDGTVEWSTRVGRGSALGGIHWGMASDGERVYVANADPVRGNNLGATDQGEYPRSPGLVALDLLTGEEVWRAPAPLDTCEGRPTCIVGSSAAPTVIPGVVFAGGLDGHIRAYSTEDGSLLWDYDTVQEYETVGGIPGQGGALDASAPVVADGLLLVNSGYAFFGQTPGNVLLAFRPGG